MAEFFNMPFNAQAKECLDRREKYPRSSWFSEKTPWIRFTSNANIDGKDAPRKQYVLFNGVKNVIWSGASGGKSGDHRPAAGVTDLTITPKNSKGTVKEIVVNWQCWHMDDLEYLEKLFMTPGVTCNVQFGWSKKMSWSGGTIDIGPSTGIEGKSAPEFFKLIGNKTLLWGGNGGGVQGMIVDFGWTINEEGGFDCVTTMISRGDALSSMGIKKNSMGIVLEVEGGEPGGKGGSSNMQATIEAAKMQMLTENQILKVGGKVYGCSLDIDADNTELQESQGWNRWWDSKFSQYVTWAWIEDLLITANVSYTSSPTPSGWATEFSELGGSSGCKTRLVSPKLYSGLIGFGHLASDIPSSKIRNYSFLESQDSQVCLLPPLKGLMILNPECMVLIKLRLDQLTQEEYQL